MFAGSQGTSVVSRLPSRWAGGCLFAKRPPRSTVAVPCIRPAAWSTLRVRRDTPKWRPYDAGCRRFAYPEWGALMARIRSVHPDLHRDKTLAQASASAERTFVRLWCHLDDEGRGEDDLELLKADLYPRHRGMDADAIDADLNELAMLGLVIRYEVDGTRLLACKPSTWARYQKPQKKQESHLPPPPEDTPPPPAIPLRDQSDTTTRPLSPVVGGEKEGSSRPRKRATQQPEDFEPSAAHTAFAEEHGLDLAWQFKKFTTHHRSKGTVFKDWDAGLWTWLRNAVEYGQGRKQEAANTPW